MFTDIYIKIKIMHWMIQSMRPTHHLLPLLLLLLQWSLIKGDLIFQLGKIWWAIGEDGQYVVWPLQPPLGYSSMQCLSSMDAIPAKVWLRIVTRYYSWIPTLLSNVAIVRSPGTTTSFQGLRNTCRWTQPNKSFINSIHGSTSTLLFRKKHYS